MDARDIVGPAAAITIAATASTLPASAAGYNSELNQPSYWGSTCTKIDMTGETMTYSVSGDNVKEVIVKGGTENAVYKTAPFTNLTAPINPKTGKPFAISHVIVCTTDGTTTSTGGGTGGQGGGHVQGDTTTPQTSSTSTKKEGKVAGTSTEMPSEIAKTGAGSALMSALGLGGAAYGATRVLRRKK